MSSDRAIDDVLCELGFGLPQAKNLARAALEEAGLTRSGKSRMSLPKLGQATRLLTERFALHCGADACERFARASGRTPVPCEPRATCERCGGSSNRRAADELVEACGRAGVRRLVVVGGSPAVRTELEAALGSRLELRTVDGTERRTGDRARADLGWADLVLLWGATELDHKVSTLYSQAPLPSRKKVLHVPRRGIAGLLAGAVEHLSRRR